jgi:hypothetical protein
MYDLFAILAGLILGIGLLVFVARALERRANSEGPLFTQPPSARSQVGSLILGLIFVGVFLAEAVFQDRYHVVFPILSLALFAYAIGAYQLLSRIQRETDEGQPPGFKRDQN